GRYLGLVRAVVAGDPREGVGHLVRRHVRGAGEDVPGRRQESRGRPAAHVVALVDVGADVVVDPNGDVLAVDEIEDTLVRVGRLVHHGAPRAPDCGDRQQDRTVELPGLVESLLGPSAPVDLSGAIRAWREVELALALAHTTRLRG